MKKLICKPIISAFVVLAFSIHGIGLPSAFGQVQSVPTPSLVALSPVFDPAVLRGLRVDPKNPFHFEFILDQGQSDLGEAKLKAEGTKLIKYFLTSLTLPENDLWVNLSPYEKDRIIPDAFGQTEMGRQLLSQDYLLKQLSASLLYPEEEIGQNFWNKVRQITAQKLGTTDAAQQAMNRIWIMPGKAVVYQDKGTAFIGETHLKVLMDEDYEAFAKDVPSRGGEAAGAISNRLPRPSGVRNDDVESISSLIFRDEILPIIEKEVNEGENFASLRQVYYSLILASWYKRTLKESILSQVYVDQKKVAGIESDDEYAKQRIYEEYLETFKNGVYNLIREEVDEQTGEMIPRKYFSGGVTLLSSAALEMRPLTSSSPIFGKLDGQKRLILLDTTTRGSKSRMSGNKNKVILNRSINVTFASLTGKSNFYFTRLEQRFIKAIVQRLIGQELELGIPNGGDKVIVKGLSNTDASKVFLLEWGQFKYVLKWSNGASFDHLIETQWKALRAINRDGSNEGIVQPVMRGRETVTFGLLEKTQMSPEYIVMDYIEGADLSNVVTNFGAFSEKMAVDFILKLAKIVQKVHAAKRIVRNLSPTNIRIRPDGRPVLYDFGDALSKTELSQQAYPKKTVQTDIDGVGLDLYFILTRDFRILSEYLQKSDLDFIQSESLRNIIAKAINLNGEQYQNISEMIADLEEIQFQLFASSALTNSLAQEEMAKKEIFTSSVVDEASASVASDVGGIDLREGNLNLDLRGEAGTFAMPTDASQFQNIQIEGLVPVILNVTPLPNLPAFINLSAAQSAEPAQISLVTEH